jgi:DNA-binding LacI/PurR family transcriptional regulator
VLGYLILTASVADEPLQQDLQHLVRCGKPAVVFDETVATPALHQKFRGPLLRYFVLPDDFAAGRIVGDYLIRRGHRRVTFLSNVGPYRGSPSQRRLGLVRAFSDAGMEEAVRECELPRSESDWSYNPHDYESEVSGFLGRHHPSGVRGSSRQHPELAGELAEEMGRRLMRYSRRARIWSALGNTLDRGGSTAWVCYNDELAVDCLDLLARRSARVPQDLSVVGFDDSDEASLRGLTSYNFNGAAYVHAMLEHLLNPARHAAFRHDSDIVRFDGFVTPRRTCAPAGRATAVPTR